MPDVQDPPRRIKTASWWLHVAIALLVGGLLVGVGTIAFSAEFYNPGAIIPNVSRIVALMLAFIALDSLPVNWGGLAFLLFILDLKIAGFALSVVAGQSALCWARCCFSLLERRKTNICVRWLFPVINPTFLKCWKGGLHVISLLTEPVLARNLFTVFSFSKGGT